MMYRIGKRIRLLALTVLGLMAIPSYHAQAQTMRREPKVVRTQFVKAADTVDPSTLTGKLIMGYQGWFNCPGDGTTRRLVALVYGSRSDCGLSAECRGLSDGGAMRHHHARRRRKSGESFQRREPGDGRDAIRVDAAIRAGRRRAAAVLGGPVGSGDAPCAQYRAGQRPSGGGGQRPRVLRHVRPQRPAQLQAEHCRAGLEKARERGDHKQSGLFAPSRASAARGLGTGLRGPTADSIRYVEIAQIAPQGQREVWRRDNHGRRAVVLANGAPRCVLRSRMEEGLAASSAC